MVTIYKVIQGGNTIYKASRWSWLKYVLTKEYLKKYNWERNESINCIMFTEIQLTKEERSLSSVKISIKF